MAYIGEQNQGQFGDKIVSERTPIIDLNGVLPITQLRDETQVSLSGDVRDAGSEYLIHHTGAGDFARFTSAERGRYLPGNSSEVGIGIRFDSLPSDGDITAYWGYFHMERDSNDEPTETIKDAFVFGTDTGGTFVEVIKNSQSLHKEYSNNWNLTKNGLLNLKAGNVFQITYTYYGYGLIKFQILDSETGGEQEVVDLHSVRITGETSLDNSNLKVGAMVKSSNSSDDLKMYVAGRQYSIIGPYQPILRSTSQVLEEVTISSTEMTPLISFKRKQDFKQAPVQISSFSIVSPENLIVDVRVDADLTGTTWESISYQLSGETSVLVDTKSDTIDRNTGIKIDEDLASGSADNKSTELSRYDNLPLSIPDNSRVTLSAKSLGADITSSDRAVVLFKLREEF